MPKCAALDCNITFDTPSGRGGWKKVFCSHRCSTRARRNRLWLSLLNGKQCIRCGNKDVRVLEFHHRNPKTRLFRIGNAIGRVAIAAIRAEVKKCDVLCSNCHIIAECEDNGGGRRTPTPTTEAA